MKAPVNAPSVIATERATRWMMTGGGILVGSLAVIKLALHLLTTGRFGYGFFVDELYFIACSEHLAWGFVDMPPFFPALTAVVRAVFGDSLAAIRLVPTLSGAVLVLLTGRIAFDLGGGRFAQGVAALSIVTAPIWLTMHSLHTMNAVEQLVWTAAAWIVVRIIRDENQKLWLVFGLIAGVGLLTKHSMLLFGFAIVIGFMVTRQRFVFARMWIWIGGLVAFVMFLPNLVWMIGHGFPHLEMLEMIRWQGRNVELGPFDFLSQQALFLNPFSLPIWTGGLWWYLGDREGRRYRVLGIAWLAVIIGLLLLDGRVYYAAPAHPMLLAAGGVAIERWLKAGRRRALKPVLVTLLVVSGTVTAPAWLPCLPPEVFVRFSETTGITQQRIENHRLGALPQLHADRFGWPEMASTVAAIYHSLPPEERSKAMIFGQNYGQAGAIDLFGPELGLPKAISAHLTYHLWGPRDATGEVWIVMEGNAETLRNLFETVELAGRVEHRWSMPYENFDVFICRDLREPVADLWPRLRNFG